MKFDEYWCAGSEFEVMEYVCAYFLSLWKKSSLKTRYESWFRSVSLGASVLNYTQKRLEYLERKYDIKLQGSIMT
jgi:hypothetical protein